MFFPENGPINSARPLLLEKEVYTGRHKAFSSFPHLRSLGAVPSYIFFLSFLPLPFPPLAGLFSFNVYNDLANLPRDLSTLPPPLTFWKSLFNAIFFCVPLVRAVPFLFFLERLERWRWRIGWGKRERGKVCISWFMGKHIYAHIQGIQSFLSPCEYHLRKFDFRIDPLFFSRPAPNPPLPYIDSENITMGLLDLTTNRGSSNAKFLVFQVGMKFSDSNLRENFRNG